MTQPPPIPYSFYGGNREAILCKDPEVIVSGPAETGKTLAYCWKLHTLAYKWPGAQFSIVRKYKSDLHGSVIRTLKRDLVDKYGPGVRGINNKYPQMIDYPKGSRIWLGGMDDPGKTLSSERDIIYVPQAEQLSLSDWEFLTRCVTGRGAIMPYTQLIGDCNPGPPTHWILSRARSGKLTKFDTTHKDNPTLWDHKKQEWTKQGKRSLSVLSNMTGTRLDRLFHGKWVMAAGAIFEIFDEVKHKCRAFDPPPQWGRAVGIDPYGAFIAGVWAALDPQGGVLHIYREYCEPYGLTTEQHVANVLRASKGETIWHWYGGGPSERQQRTDFAGFGLPLVAPVITEVWSQIDKIIELLNHDALMIHDSCPGLLSEIGAYRRKMTRDGQVTDKIEDKDRFHLLDSLRYLVAGLVGNTGSVVNYDPVRVGAW